MATRKTLVLGASDHPTRYSYLAMGRLKDAGHPVVAIGKRTATAHGIEINTQPYATNDIDTITLYLNPAHQRDYYQMILDLKPRRIIFNPGTENPELEERAEAAGIQVIEACTLVMLATGQYA